MIEELEESALEQLKRADHLIYVTLKYTRTADVIKNVIKRLINAYDFSVESGLKCIGVKLDIIRRNRIVQFSKYFKDVKSDIDFYLFLRQVDQASFSRKEEYRKNVSLVTRFGEINIAILQKYFDRTKDFVVLVEGFINRYSARKRKKKVSKKKVKKKKR